MSEPIVCDMCGQVRRKTIWDIISEMGERGELRAFPISAGHRVPLNIHTNPAAVYSVP